MRVHIVTHGNHQGSRISLVSNDLEDVVIRGSFLAPTAAFLRLPQLVCVLRSQATKMRAILLKAASEEALATFLRALLRPPRLDALH
jgi:hypothetical protein